MARVRRLYSVLCIFGIVVFVIVVLHFRQMTPSSTIHLKKLDDYISKYLADKEYFKGNSGQNTSFGDGITGQQAAHQTSSYIGSYGMCSHTDKKTLRKPANYVYFTDNFKIDKEPVASWIHPSQQRRFCDDKVTVYNNRFAIINNVKMYPERRDGFAIQSKGGEEIKQVLNQNLEKEDYRFQSGFWEINCHEGSSKSNTMDTFKWLKNLKFNSDDNKSEVSVTDTEYVNTYTIAVARGDYANLHNWVRCIFNTFLMMVHFNVQPSDVSVLFLDGHPLTNLDKTWDTLYGSPVRVGHLSKPVVYKNLILGLLETDGPITDFKQESISYTEEFRSFVLQQHTLKNVSNLNCNKLKITIILRRNAVYHPRNIQGNVGRKIFNEAELIGSLIETFNDACVQGVLMESLPMALQLEIISQTDVLIGMHGAGMSHTMFLPKHAAILELFSKGFKNGRPWFECFQAIARWRGLKYDSWENFDSSLDMPHDFTVLPVDVLVQKTKQLIKSLCN